MIKLRCDRYLREFSSLAGSVYGALQMTGEGYVEVVFVTDAQMRRLNKAQRGIDSTTDVLSFPSVTARKPLDRTHYPFEFDECEQAVFLGSIVLSMAAVKRQAAEYGHSLRRERAYLFVHGMLHLVGFDHETSEQRAAMRAEEERVLNAAGITREG